MENDNVYVPSRTIIVPPAPVMEVVGNCPKCGSPIYAEREVRVDQAPIVRRSCFCADTFQETLRTK